MISFDQDKGKPAGSTEADKLDRQLIEEIKAVSGFTEREVKQLHVKFCSLDPLKGEISTLSFLRLPELNMPLVSRMLRALRLSNVRSLNFRDFTKALAVFHSKTPTEEKLDFLFRLYDGDRDNLISREDLGKTLSIISGDADPALIEYAVMKTFEELGDGNQSHLNREDFGRGLNGVDITKLVSFAFDDS
jgi:Ca2+-binding EF-hand superfamily protein